jgi:hypothetical protein
MNNSLNTNFLCNANKLVGQPSMKWTLFMYNNKKSLCVEMYSTNDGLQISWKKTMQDIKKSLGFMEVIVGLPLSRNLY